MKKLFVCVVGAAALLCASAVHAQDVQNIAPDVYVRNITIPETSYKAGDTVAGTVDLINGDATGIPDIVYQISLGTDYQKNGLIGALYDTITSSPIFLSPQADQTVSFSYKLPVVFDTTTNLTLHIQAFLKSGVPLGWTDMPITVSGGIPALKIGTVSLMVGGTTYNAGVGPTIYQDGTSTLSVSLTNPATSTLTVTPHVVIYDHSTTGKMIEQYSEAAFSMKAGGSAVVNYTVPVFNYTPGVYVGEITFTDSNNLTRSVPIDFRYIVAGNIVTLHSITTQKTTAAVGDSIPITINYSGTPYDISTGTTQGNNNALLDVQLYNEKDQLVGEYQDTTDFNSGNSKTVPIAAAVEAQALRINVSVTSAGKILASYAAPLTGNYDQAHQQALDEQAAHAARIQLAIESIVALLIACIVVAILFKLLNPKHRTTLVLIFALTAAGAYFGIHTVSAYTTISHQSINGVWDYTGYNFNNGSYPTSLDSQGYKPQGYQNPDGDGSKWHVVGDCKTDDLSSPSSGCDDLSPQVTINTPGTTDTFTPGQTFYLTGSAFALACMNNPLDIIVSGTFNGGSTLTTTKNNINNYNGKEGDLSSFNTTFSVGPFTAPTTPGTYTLNFRVDSYTNIPGRTTNMSDYNKDSKAPGGTLDPATTGGYLTGSVIVTVVPPVPVVALVATPTSILSGNTSTLKWSATNSPTSCTASASPSDSSWSGSVTATSATSTQSTSALTQTTTYTLVCKNSGGTSNTATATVTVTEPNVPVVTLTATSPITSGATATLSFSATNSPTSCTASASPSDSSWNGSKTVTSSTKTQSTSALTQTTTYTLTCTNAGGTSAPASATVTVTSPQTTAPKVSLTASPTSVYSGSPSTLIWSVDNGGDSGTSCDDGGDGWYTGGMSGSVSTGALYAATSYTLNCKNNAGSDSDTATVAIEAPQASIPVVSLSAVEDSNFSGTNGGNIYLNWQTQNVPTTCLASGYGWNGDVDPTGGTSQPIYVSSSETYTITCSNSAGSSSDTATVTVTPTVYTTPVVTLSAVPTSDFSTTQGGDINLVWTVNDYGDSGTICLASGYNWNGDVDPTGGTSQPIYVSSSETYTLTCTNSAGLSGNAVAQVSVIPQNTAPTVSLNAQPSSIVNGNSSVLTWSSSSNAVSCSSNSFSTGGLTNSSSGVIVYPTVTTVYSITCTDSAGDVSSPATATVTVSALSAPTANLYANGTTLTWNSTNADSCVGSGFSTSGLTSSSVGVTVSPGNYSITCTNSTTGASAAASITVNNPTTGPACYPTQSNLRVTSAIVKTQIVWQNSAASPVGWYQNNVWLATSTEFTTSYSTVGLVSMKMLYPLGGGSYQLIPCQPVPLNIKPVPTVGEI